MAKGGLGLEITELRLGLPGGNDHCGSVMVVDKKEKKKKKRVFSDMISDENSSNVGHKKIIHHESKNQIVGWPPVCSYRKNKNSFVQEKSSDSESAKLYVKVSMDGVPFLRKIDLNTHEAYSDLALAFETLFGCFGIDGGMLKDSENSEYIPIYEDKDGDWMLVGDVPWEMFIDSCKRLRIMKRTDKAKGLEAESINFKGNLEGTGEAGVECEWDQEDMGLSF